MEDDAGSIECVCPSCELVADLVLVWIYLRRRQLIEVLRGFETL